jgi:hypothetical protein
LLPLLQETPYGFDIRKVPESKQFNFLILTKSGDASKKRPLLSKSKLEIDNLLPKSWYLQNAESTRKPEIYSVFFPQLPTPFSPLRRLTLLTLQGLSDLFQDWPASCPSNSREQQVMRISAKFDIFLRLSDGQPIWIKSVESLEEAERQLARMAADSPGNYFIFNAANGQVTVPIQACA